MCYTEIRQKTLIGSRPKRLATGRGHNFSSPITSAESIGFLVFLPFGDEAGMDSVNDVLKIIEEKDATELNKI